MIRRVEFAQLKGSRLSSLRENDCFSCAAGYMRDFYALLQPRLDSVVRFLHPRRRFVPPIRSRLYVSAGINLAKRIRLQAAAAKRKIQSARRRFRNFVFLSPATHFIQANTFFTNLRFRWLIA